MLATATLKDENGEAVVVHLRNIGKDPLANLPIAVEVADQSGRAVYTNTTPGLEPALAHVGAAAPGQELCWVNDQVARPAAGAGQDARGGIRASPRRAGHRPQGRPPTDRPGVRELRDTAGS